MSCQCSERKAPLTVPAGSNQMPRRWDVTRRNWHASAFNGGRWTYSDYSDVRCRVCGARWRTKASYVEELYDAPESWIYKAERLEPSREELGID